MVMAFNSDEDLMDIHYSKITLICVRDTCINVELNHESKWLLIAPTTSALKKISSIFWFFFYLHSFQCNISQIKVN